MGVRLLFSSEKISVIKLKDSSFPILQVTDVVNRAEDPGYKYVDHEQRVLILLSDDLSEIASMASDCECASSLVLQLVGLRRGSLRSSGGPSDSTTESIGSKGPIRKVLWICKGFCISWRQLSPSAEHHNDISSAKNSFQCSVSDIGRLA